MKLLVDCHVFDGNSQGTTSYIEGLYTHMTKHQDITFYFAAHNVDNIKKKFGEAPNIHYLHLTHTGSILRLTLDFPKLIKQNNIDYAHFQYISPIVKRCKEIVTIHDVLFLDFPQFFPWKYKLKNGFFFRKSALRANIITTVSHYSQLRIAHWFGIPEEKIAIVHSAVLPTTENMFIPNVKKKYNLDKFILTVSRLEPRKNHLLLLQVFVEMELYKNGWDLVMIGAPDLKNVKLQKYYEGLSEDVIAHVKMMTVPFPDLVGLYQQANLFVFPSFAEGFGLPPLEAIEYGCPLLCSNVTGMKEFGLPEEMVFNPNNKEDLKNKIKKILINGETYKESSSLTQRIRKEYNWQLNADKFYEILKNAD